VHSSTRGIDFLPSGPLPPSPAALLGTSRAREVLSELRDRYDQIVVDTPPVTAGADVTALGPALDGLVLVVDLGHSGRRAITAARDQIERSGARLLGVVLNRVRAWDRRYGLEGYGGYVPAPGANGAGRRSGAARRVAELLPRGREGRGRLGRPEEPTQERGPHA
jgi:Mrp family chromosome partitioning ATPase